MANQSNNKVQLHKAEIGDAFEINAMATEIWLQHYPPIIGLEQVHFMLEKMYDIPVLETQIKTKTQEFYWISNNSKRVGFIAIEQAIMQEQYVQKFYILPSLQGNGIGMQAFSELCHNFPAVQTIKLQVNRQNYTAINFYFKIGFKIERVADFDIGQGYFMNDFVMTWTRR